MCYYISFKKRKYHFNHININNINNMYAIYTVYTINVLMIIIFVYIYLIIHDEKIINIYISYLSDNNKINELFNLASIFHTLKKYDKAELCYGFLINNGNIKAIYLLSHMMDDMEKEFYYNF